MALLTGFGYLVYSAPPFLRFVMCFPCILVFVGFRRDKRRFQRLANSRIGESICGFARSFDVRATDTWVIRAAYQDLQLIVNVPNFPVRASDLLAADLGLEPEDVEDLLVDVARRTGRSLDKTESNPYYGRVNSVKDLVLFINAQPRGEYQLIDEDRGVTS